MEVSWEVINLFRKNSCVGGGVEILQLFSISGYRFIAAMGGCGGGFGLSFVISWLEFS